MSRRQNSPELGFGSDSFLDIIANIVGILIILIVIAGVRVSQSPVEIAKPNLPPASEPALQPERAPNYSPELPKLLVAGPKPPLTQRRLPIPPNPLSPLPPAAAPIQQPALKTEIERLVARIETLNASTAEDRQMGRQTVQIISGLAEQRKELEQELATAELARVELRRTLADLEGSLVEGKRRRELLREELQQLQDRTAPVETLEHQLTPISRLVDDRELHFRIMGGRVAYVPVEELLGLVKQQVRRRIEWLIENRQHQGNVGPLDGFRMEYVVARRPGSAIAQAQGEVTVQISLRQWQVESTSDLQSETADQAVRSGSRFLNRLRMSEADSSLTFWVYPDSFEEFRQIQQAAHRLGYSVAGRPLPSGMPIAGSPSGSRSAAQ